MQQQNVMELRNQGLYGWFVIWFYLVRKKRHYL